MQEDWGLLEDLVVKCPHCNQLMLISEINCQIFRHAAYKVNNEQIPPHTSQAECERLVRGELIYGCGKPFRIVKNDFKDNIAVKCEYI